jgi:hypothetical protein
MDAHDVNARPVRPVKPQSLIDAEEFLIDAGQGFSWWRNVGV